MYKFIKPGILSLLCCLCALPTLQAQVKLPGVGAGTEAAARPDEYIIAGVTVSGITDLDQDLLLAVAGLSIGEKVVLPNDDGIARAIRNLMKQELFADVAIEVTNTAGNKIFLNIAIEERPRLSKYGFRGIKKGEATELRTKLNLTTNKVVTEATKKDAVVRIKKHFVDKGFGRTTVTVTQRPDTARKNTTILVFHINKGSKTHINQINIVGNEAAEDGKLKGTFRSTKEMTRITLHPQEDEPVYADNEKEPNYLSNFGFLSLSKTLEKIDPYFRFKLFASSKFNQEKYEADKQAMIGYYNSLGYRDAQIADDTVYSVKSGNLNVDIKVNEGRRYYFGDIVWKGNTKYSSEELSARLGIKRGDVYNQDLLDARIGRAQSPDGAEDIGSLYMNDGYLFFNIEPTETSVIGDTINYELRITEGSQATIGLVNIYGNDRTNEHVIRRELYTLPGNKFSREDIIRSQRQIATLGFFDAEKISILPKPHPENGTVDIDYTVVEKSSDQLQLSAGFGGGVKFYGNVGITFNNFSLRNIFRPRYWDPLPIGDGQKLSLNYSSNGQYYNSLNASFTEPWLGGKKPNALTTNIVYSKYATALASSTTDASNIRVLGGGVSLSKRLKWPDDNFVLTYGFNYQNFKLTNYSLGGGDLQNFNNGSSNNLYFKIVLARYSLDQPLYPRGGSNINFTFQFTPPYSSFNNKDYNNEVTSEKYKWIEYHKYRFTADWYKQIAGNLVFKLSTKYGFMGYYDKTIGYSPFERFQLGGDGLSGNQFFVGKDIISQRGYEIYQSNAVIFNKYVAEIRYPLSLSPHLYNFCSGLCRRGQCLEQL